MDASGELRWAPLTVVFATLSAAWVKGPLMIAAGVCGDLRARCLPLATICATVSVVVAAAASGLLKELFDRLRPALADPTFAAAVSTPATPSFPSGHAATAFAAAAAVGALHPRLRWPLFAVAALVGLSRVYLGVHYGLDVLAGATLGTAVGLGVVRVTRRLPRVRARAVPA